MSPAQRRHKFYQRKLGNKTGKTKRSFIGLLIFLAFLLGILFLILRSGVWAESDKFTFVLARTDGSVVVSSFDKNLEKITNVYIPGSTQVSVSRGLGTWKLRSVWRLGENEGLGGNLVAETITKNFHFPVYAFAEEGSEGLVSGEFSEALQAVFLPYKSNLTFSDKLRIAIFSMNVKPTKRITLNLENTAFLKLTEFIDGEEGYIITSLVPNELITVFSDTAFVEGNIRIQIKDHTEVDGLAENVGQTLEFLGGKVASLVREESKDIDCIVFAKDKGIQKKIALLLNCSSSNNNPESNFDAEISIGSEFAKRY